MESVAKEDVVDKYFVESTNRKSDDVAVAAPLDVVFSLFEVIGFL